MSVCSSSTPSRVIQFFKNRKGKISECKDGDSVRRMMRSEAFFFRGYGVRRGDFVERLLISTYTLAQDAFTIKLSQIGICKSNEALQTMKPFNILLYLLDSLKLRPAALQFFIHRLNYIRDNPNYCEMLLLLFCECEKPHCQLTKEALLCIVQNIKKSRNQFESLIRGKLCSYKKLGVELCLNLLHYSTLVLGKADPLLVQIIMETLKSSKETGAQFQGFAETYLSKDYLEQIVFLLEKGNAFLFLYPEYDYLKEAVEFVQHCDPEFSQQSLEQMMYICNKHELWKTYGYLMHLLPLHAKYNSIVTFCGPLERLDKFHFNSFRWSHADSLIDIYLMSRFSHSPSQKLRMYILSLVPALKDYEPDDSVVMNWTGECILPMEVLLAILLLTDSITQLLAVPLVCKSWKAVGQQLLKISPSIHTLFISDIRKYGFEKIHCNLPWKAFFKTSYKVAEFVTSTAIITCSIPKGDEYNRICARYFLNLSAPQNERHLTFSTHYAKEYIRLGVSDDCNGCSLPPLVRPASMKILEYGAVIRKLSRKYSVVPRIPQIYLLKKLDVLHKAINDDRALEMIMKTRYSPRLDIICANILTQQVPISSGLLSILSRGSEVFRDLFAGSTILPLTPEVLGADLDLLIGILFNVSPEMQKCACELLVHVLCSFQSNDPRTTTISEKLKGIKYLYRGHLTYPIQYMLRNPQQFSIEQFKLVQKVTLKSGLCSEADLRFLPLDYIFPDPSAWI